MACIHCTRLTTGFNKKKSNAFPDWYMRIFTSKQQQNNHTRLTTHDQKNTPKKRIFLTYTCIYYLYVHLKKKGKKKKKSRTLRSENPDSIMRIPDSYTHLKTKTKGCTFMIPYFTTLMGRQQSNIGENLFREQYYVQNKFWEKWVSVHADACKCVATSTRNNIS